jgi:hypothetical protein
MSLLRNREQTTLADLNAFGGGLLQRYQQLVASDIDEALGSALGEILARRRPLLDALAAREAARNDKPKAADQEVNELRAIADRLLGALFGPELPVRRVVKAEAAWQARLRSAQSSELNWSAAERDLLDELEADARAAREALRTIAPG